MKKSSMFVTMLIVCMTVTLIPVNTFAAEGLQVSILRAGIDSSLRAEAEFTIKDNNGAPLSLSEVSFRGFTLVRLDVLNPSTGSAAYNAYFTRIATAPEGTPNAGSEAEQGFYDHDGEFITHGPGHYTYVFSHEIPADYDQTKTHTVWAVAQRRVGDKTYYANPLYHFVPNGSDVVQLRKVVTTEGCNVCHTSLGLHGGAFKEVAVCSACHTPPSISPANGNSLDFTTMVHKIHMGAELPSVQAGTPYQFLGHGVTDFSDVHYPQSILNCQSCHTGEQGDVYKTAPSRRACGSCHDNVNFMTGEGHGPGIPQMDDSNCTACHPAEGSEFDISVAGAHVNPIHSDVIQGVNIEILDVMNAIPGQTPIVRYKVTDDAGNPIDPADLRTFTIRLAGPTDDITHYIDESAVDGHVQDGDAYTYAFTEALPADAKGTYLVTIDNRYDVTLVDNPEGEDDVTVTITADNPEFLVNVEGGEITPRREIVSIDKCNACHDRLALHGGQRNGINNCATCHHPKAGDDLTVRAENGADGGASISLSVMIHKIHSGTDLSQDYTVYRSRGVYNFNHIEFPGMVSDCQMCHIDDVALPLPATNESVEIAQVDGTTKVQQPVSANCTSCHDMSASEAHASLNTTADGIESCAVCHREGRSASIAEAHAQKVFLNVIERTSADPTKIKEWLMHQ